MKQADELLDHLLRPFGGRVSRYRCYERIKLLLPQPIVEEIAFMYVKNKTLFFVVKNSAIVFELNYKLNSVKPVLTAFAATHPDMCTEPFDDVKAFATKYVPQEPPQELKFFAIPEKSKGEFENPMKEPQLYAIVEAIRQTIKKKNSL